jgi:NDP-sugar pyrophosphorylase family protein
MCKIVRNAIILAGGHGSRMMPLTADFNKTVLPFPGRPNVVRLMHQLQKAGVTHFFVDTHYQAHSVIREIRKEHFGAGVTVKFTIWDNLYPDATSVRKIIYQNKNAFMMDKNSKHQHAADDFFWVVSGDVFYPTADLARFQRAMIELRHADDKVLGGMGFVLRPQKSLLNKQPSAVINEQGVIQEFTQNRVESLHDAEDIYQRCLLPAIRGGCNPNKMIPMNTSIYLLSPKMLDWVGQPKDGSNYDLGRYVFTHPRLREKMLGFVFPAFDMNKAIFHDLGGPEDYYRAMFTFFLTSRSELKEDYITEANSWIGQRRTISGKVRDSWIGGNVTVGPHASVSRSVIIGNCWLDNVDVDSAIILPGTYINYPSQMARYNLQHSIIGGRREPTFLDRQHLLATSTRQDKVILTPDDNGMIKPISLDFSDADMRLPQEAFSVDPGAAQQQKLDFEKL